MASSTPVTAKISATASPERFPAASIASSAARSSGRAAFAARSVGDRGAARDRHGAGVLENAVDREVRTGAVGQRERHAAAERDLPARVHHHLVHHDGGGDGDRMPGLDRDHAVRARRRRGGRDPVRSVEKLPRPRRPPVAGGHRAEVIECLGVNECRKDEQRECRTETDATHARERVPGCHEGLRNRGEQDLSRDCRVPCRCALSGANASPQAQSSCGELRASLIPGERVHVTLWESTFGVAKPARAAPGAGGNPAGGPGCHAVSPSSRRRGGPRSAWTECEKSRVGRGERRVVRIVHAGARTRAHGKGAAVRRARYSRSASFTVAFFFLPS